MGRGVPAEVIRHLQAIPVFRSVSKNGIRAVARALTEVDVREGKVLVREGEFSRHLYVIVRGTAEVTTRGKKVNELGPGDFFGEMALLSGAARTATVTARTDMRVMILGPQEFRVIIDREPRMARQMLEQMAKRIQAFEQAWTH